MEHITSAQNTTLKLARKLIKSARERQRSGKILLDGVHLVQAYADRFGLSGTVLLFDEGAMRSSEIGQFLDEFDTQAKRFVLSSELFASVSPVETPTGIIALCDRPALEAAATTTAFKVLLDGIQDPGNLGSILRTAAATGVDEVLLSPSCADPWSPRSLRGGMGAQFVLAVREIADVLGAVRDFDGMTVATSVHSGQRLMECRLSEPLLAIFGGEGAGLSTAIIEKASVAVHIPLANEMESLNVAAAVAMLCYERLRQKIM